MRGCCPLTLTILILLQGICLDTVHSPCEGDGGRRQGGAFSVSPVRRPSRGQGDWRVCYCSVRVFVYFLTPIFIADLRYALVFYTFFSIVVDRAL